MLPLTVPRTGSDVDQLQLSRGELDRGTRQGAIGLDESGNRAGSTEFDCQTQLSILNYQMGLLH
jgi:hypothetical protein